MAKMWAGRFSKEVDSKVMKPAYKKPILYRSLTNKTKNFKPCKIAAASMSAAVI